MRHARKKLLRKTGRLAVIGRAERIRQYGIEQIGQERENL
jgi:hypothetical protein